MATATPTPQAVVVEAGLGHADAISAIHGRCFDEPWSPFTVRQVLAMPGAFGLLAVPARSDVTEATLYGFALARAAAQECELLSLAVAPAARSAGIGRALLAAAVARARVLEAESLFLEVAEDNEVAQALYRQAGFRPVGRRPAYYRRPRGPAVAALTLALVLAP